MAQLPHASRLQEAPWHALDDAAVLEELRTSTAGLETGEAERRLGVHGPNTLPSKPPPTIWAILGHQVLNPLIFILAAAAVASLVIGEGVDALFILVVIALNTGLGAYQEYSAEKSAASLQNLLRIRARVRRGGRESEVPAEELVPGDVVLLESGNKVPADLRLLQANNLTADESFLTGESIAAEKRAGVLAADLPVSERVNMAFGGATVTTGRGLGVVTSTGAGTQVGRIAASVAESEGGKPPLVLRMEAFIKHITVLVVLISLGLAALLYFQGQGLSEIFFFVVALAVSAIPEGLPVALTVTLSIATRRMSRRNVIVRKLTAVESLGSCTVIASDKTGTLTVNAQTARRIVLPGGRVFGLSGEGYSGDGELTGVDGAPVREESRAPLGRLATLAVLANEASLTREGDGWTHRGDAMDVAFLAMAHKAGIDPSRVREDHRLLAEIPYESERKFSAAFFELEGARHVAAKGAVETILGFCSAARDGDRAVALDGAAVEAAAGEMATEGLRVLAVCGGRLDGARGEAEPAEEALAGLEFHGLVGFIDPLRPEAIDSVEKCRAAGIRVLMITGDHPATAGAIARDLGISAEGDPVVSGQALAEAGPPDSPAFEALVSASRVFARVSPTQKLEIVEALIRRGEFVAVTGDGVNDAPALRRANIGVAMGSGTDVAKEVGSMIVADDNFASIVSGVEEGRFAYDNVRKVIYLLISTGAAEVLMFIAAILAGLPIPLLAVQLLWLNLVTNGIQDVALAFEGGEPGAMKRRPRKPGESIFDGRMISQTIVSGLVMGAVAFGLWSWLIRWQGVDEASARNTLLLLMVLMQNVHVFNCRSETTSAFRVPIRRNVVLIGGVLLAQGLHILCLHIPFMQRTLRIEPVQISEWILALGLALSLLVAMEVFKLARRARTARP
jgi:magnesium-transporting ATPase (P-type)